jgi:hypothetical protein
VDDVPRAEAVAGGDPRLTGRAWGETPCLSRQLRSGRAVDRAVHAAAALERRVRRVHDRIDVEVDDASDDDRDAVARFGRRVAVGAQ